MGLFEGWEGVQKGKAEFEGERLLQPIDQRLWLCHDSLSLPSLLIMILPLLSILVLLQGASPSWTNFTHLPIPHLSHTFPIPCSHFPQVHFWQYTAWRYSSAWKQLKQRSRAQGAKCKAPDR